MARILVYLPLDAHRQAWLDAHPDRSEAWLREKAREGFDVHHLDGDHSNNDPANLVLIEHQDHMRLHSMPSVKLVSLPRKKGLHGRWLNLPDGGRVRLYRGERKKRALEAWEDGDLDMRRVIAG